MSCLVCLSIPFDLMPIPSQEPKRLISRQHLSTFEIKGWPWSRRRNNFNMFSRLLLKKYMLSWEFFREATFEPLFLTTKTKILMKRNLFIPVFVFIQTSLVSEKLQWWRCWSFCPLSTKRHSSLPLLLLEFHEEMSHQSIKQRKDANYTDKACSIIVIV